MKLNYFYLIASLVVCMAGCTTNEEGGDGPQPGSKRDAYTSVTIKLPAVNGTKAASPSYGDGDQMEYEVKDLTLLFFRAPDGVSSVEDDYILSEFVSTIPALQLMDGGGALHVTLPVPNAASSSGGITQRFSTGAIPISETSTHVLALLNLTGAYSSMGGSLTSLLRIGNAFKQINSSIPLIKLSDLTGDDGFLMLTAPVWNVGNHASTLTKITPRTKEEAEKEANKTAISVERIVAKVSLAANAANYTKQDADDYNSFKVGSGVYAGDKIQILGWLLGNTNTITYPFRKVEDNWSSLFSSVWENGILSGTRIHWAKDPNYTSAETASFDNPDIQISVWNSLAPANPSDIVSGTTYNEYCLENTCNYDIMYKANVTRAIVKAKYYPNTSGNNTTDNDGTCWSFTSAAAHYSEENMYKEIAKWVTTNRGNLAFPDAVTDNLTFTTNNAGGLSGSATDQTGGSWKITIDGGTGVYNLSSVSYTSQAGAVVNLTDALKTSFTRVVGQIQKYDKGICYYEVFIRHFTNDEGGYDSGWTIGGDGYNAQQLGRYGVVRNNWYTLTINKIEHPGEPNIPDDGQEPVDAQTAYIDCDIAITAWALRNHEIDL